ncbi:MAG: radical SAM protein [Candidatus Woesearchaeota archaeon]
MQAYIGGVGTLRNSRDNSEDSIVIFFAGCNFRCPYCYNSSILGFSEEFLIDTRDVKLKIEEILKSDNRISSVILTGGEPLLQRQAMLSIARFCRMKGLKIVLETNGSKPNSLKSLLAEGLADSVIMDLKSPPEEGIFERTTRSSTFFKSPGEIIRDITYSIELLRSQEDEVQIEFKTLMAEGLTSSLSHLLKIAEWIGNTNATWTISPVEKQDFSAVLEQFRRIIPALEQRFPQLKVRIENPI